MKASHSWCRFVNAIVSFSHIPKVLCWIHWSTLNLLFTELLEKPVWDDLTFVTWHSVLQEAAEWWLFLDLCARVLLFLCRSVLSKMKCILIFFLKWILNGASFCCLQPSCIFSIGQDSVFTWVYFYGKIHGIVKQKVIEIMLLEHILISWLGLKIPLIMVLKCRNMETAM